jgi:hypothetical protein
MRTQRRIGIDVECDGQRDRGDEGLTTVLTDNRPLSTVCAGLNDVHVRSEGAIATREPDLDEPR